MSTHSAPPRAWPWGLLVFLFLAAVGLPACVWFSNYHAGIDRALEAGRPADGVAILESHESSYGNRSKTLYLMDLGMLQHLAGQYQQSNRSLSTAEDLTETLYTRRVSAEIEAFFTTDNTLPYEGEDFEKVMLNVLMAMNYVQLGLWDDALVEARKVDHKLSVLNDRAGGKQTYSKDPLARYLSGVLYEATGDLTNALVAYRLARDAFEQAGTQYGTPTPDLLRRDLLRLTEALGLTDEHEEYRRLFPDITWQASGAGEKSGELVFVAYEGRAPLKRDMFIDVPFSVDALAIVLATKGLLIPQYRDHRAAESVLYGLTGHVIRLAIPKFVPRRSAITHTEALVADAAGQHAAPLALIEDVTAIAVKDLDERIVRTTAKAAARAAWKYALAEGVRIGVTRAVGRDGGALAGAIAGALARTVAIASEEADKRSWATLPDRILLGRLVVAPGTYDVTFRYQGRAGEVLESQTVRGVTLQTGRKRFITTRILR